MSNPSTDHPPPAAPSDFIRDIVAAHVAENKYPRIHTLSQIDPEIKIIAASGLTSESQVKSPVVRAFLPKPYSAQDLLNTVSAVLHA